MEKRKIIVTTTSSNLWWGIYGLSQKTGWEDLNLFYENNERIGGVSLNSKGYLRAGLDDLLDDPYEIEFVKAIKNYLTDNKCHYWYFYDDKDEEDFYEVPYCAPKNDKGVKPRFMDIWHPDEGIGLSTIESAIKAFAKEHLGIIDCEVEIRDCESLEDSIKSFEEETKYREASKIEIKFSEKLIKELSQYWKKSKEEVLKKLERSIK